MDVGQAYTLRKTDGTLIWDAYRSQHGGQRKVIGSQSRNRIKKFQLSNLLENSEIKRQPIGNQRSRNKISSSGKDMRTGVSVTAYVRKRTVTVQPEVK
jgi:hypothetical protein